PAASHAEVLVAVDEGEAHDRIVTDRTNERHGDRASPCRVARRALTCAFDLNRSSMSPLRSLRDVGADGLEVVPRHPLSNLVPEDRSLDDRSAVMNTVVDACVDDFLDDLVGAVEMTCIRRASGEVDAARQTFRAEELLDCVSVGTR